LRALITRIDTGPAAASGDAIRRAQVLIHELANLVDGSLRLIDLARRSLGGAEPAHPDRALRHLDSAHAAMSHIASIVRAGASPGSSSASLVGEPDPPASLASAIASAVDVLRARARARNIDLAADVEHAAGAVPADEVYAVVTNAVRNSIEAIGRGGRIEVRARMESGEVVLEVLDDGVGPPADASRVFELGFTTKPGSTGVGLALAGEVITELGGTIALLPRGLPDASRPGAILRARYPVPGAVEGGAS
jgi:signal transduction histidine kinase